MQETFGGTHSIVHDYVAFILIHIYTLKESRISAVLNEWERTCLPPQNEEVSEF